MNSPRQNYAFKITELLHAADPSLAFTRDPVAVHNQWLNEGNRLYFDQAKDAMEVAQILDIEPASVETEDRNFDECIKATSYHGYSVNLCMDTMQETAWENAQQRFGENEWRGEIKKEHQPAEKRKLFYLSLPEEADALDKSLQKARIALGESIYEEKYVAAKLYKLAKLSELQCPPENIHQNGSEFAVTSLAAAHGDPDGQDRLISIRDALDRQGIEEHANYRGPCNDVSFSASAEKAAVALDMATTDIMYSLGLAQYTPDSGATVMRIKGMGEAMHVGSRR